MQILNPPEPSPGAARHCIAPVPARAPRAGEAPPCSTINEIDFALRLSRIKPGDAQHARLGPYIKRLDSLIAHYINLIDASWVQELHSPFAEPAGKNEKLKTFFRDAFTGQPAEEPLRFRAEGNWYEVPR